MKLYVDDVRIPPKGEGWKLVRTIDEAIRLISTAPVGDSVTEVSLDHDIGYVNSETGATVAETYEAVARFIVTYNELSRYGTPYFSTRLLIKVNVHSANPVGRKQLIDILGDSYVGPAS